MTEGRKIGRTEYQKKRRKKGRKKEKRKKGIEERKRKVEAVN